MHTGGKGQSFFIKHLLQNVIFQEAGIAGQNRWWELRSRAVIWSGYAALLALLIIISVLWFTSYGNNRNYLDEVQAKVPALDQQIKALRNRQQGDLLRCCRCLTACLNYRKVKPLISITRQSPAVWDCIAVMMSQMPRKRSTRKPCSRCCCRKWQCALPPRLRNDNGSDVEYSYEALKAYQMLYQPKHYDGKFLLSG